MFGSALSPNGLGFSTGAMLSLALLDKIVAVDNEKMQVRVQVCAQGIGYRTMRRCRSGCRCARTQLRKHWDLTGVASHSCQ